VCRVSFAGLVRLSWMRVSRSWLALAASLAEACSTPAPPPPSASDAAPSEVVTRPRLPDAGGSDDAGTTAEQPADAGVGRRAIPASLRAALRPGGTVTIARVSPTRTLDGGVHPLAQIAGAKRLSPFVTLTPERGEWVKATLLDPSLHSKLAKRCLATWSAGLRFVPSPTDTTAIPVEAFYDSCGHLQLYWGEETWGSLLLAPALEREIDASLPDAATP